MNIFLITLSSQTLKMNGHGETFLSLGDSGRAIISIVTVLPLQEVGRLSFTAQQRAGTPSRHGSGGSGGGTSFPS